MAADELVFSDTVLGTVRVRYERKVAITVEDVVETNAKALLAGMKLELRRRQLASGNNDLDEVTYFTGRL